MKADVIDSRASLLIPHRKDIPEDPKGQGGKIREFFQNIHGCHKPWCYKGPLNIPSHHDGKSLST